MAFSYMAADFLEANRKVPLWSAKGSLMLYNGSDYPITFFLQCNLITGAILSVTLKADDTYTSGLKSW